MIVTIQTSVGPKKLFVCDYCRASIIQKPHGYCSGKCYRGDMERSAAVIAKMRDGERFEDSDGNAIDPESVTVERKSP